METIVVNVKNDKDANIISGVATALNSGMTLEDFKVPTSADEQKPDDSDFDLDSITVEMKQQSAEQVVESEPAEAESAVEQSVETVTETVEQANASDIELFNDEPQPTVSATGEVDYNVVAKQIINTTNFPYLDVRAAFTRKVHRTFDIGVWEQFTDTKLRLKMGRKICALAKAFMQYPNDVAVAKYCGIHVEDIEQDNPNKYWLAAFNYLMKKQCPEIDLAHQHIEKKVYGKQKAD